MRYDSIIIGGGLAGMTSAIRCAEAGLKTAVISFGESSLTFASGAIDVLGRQPDGSPVQAPFEAINQLPGNHPYHKVGPDNLKVGLEHFQQSMAASDLTMVSQGEKNHWRISALGSLIPAWLSQISMTPLPFTNPAKEIKQVAVINIAGFRDFQPSLAASGLKRHPAFAKCRITSSTVSPEELALETRNPFELRSIELARVLSSEQSLNLLAKALGKAAGPADLIILPAVLEDTRGNSRIPELSDLLGCPVMEVASLPPSLPGLRMTQALKQRFNALGGMLIEGDQVVKGEFDNGRLCSVETHHNKDLPLYADHFVLATGTFLSKGLKGERNRIVEPVFDLDIAAPENRSEWSTGSFLDSWSHHFMEYGVTTNRQLQPCISNTPISNLYCAGSVLAGFNPVAEGSAGGVSIATGYFAAEQIIATHTSSKGTAGTEKAGAEKATGAEK